MNIRFLLEKQIWEIQSENVFSNQLRSSHGKAVGAVIDGCPANLELSPEDIQKELDKRKPGTSGVTTPRKEEDEVQILSGIFEGKTDGTPITGIVYNNNQHSKDYSMFKKHSPSISWRLRLDEQIWQL